MDNAQVEPMENDLFPGFAELERVGWTSEMGADGYIKAFSSASDMTIPGILNKLNGSSRVLDLCCGHGNVTAALLREGHTVIGVDFSPVMIARARETAHQAEFMTADAQDLPFDDRDFDAVVCNFGISHVPNQPRALAEVGRLVKSGGVFVMTSWVGPSESPAFRIFYSGVQQYGDPSVKLPDGPNFHFFDDRDAAERELRAAGLSMSDHERIGCFWDIDQPDDLADIFEFGAPRGGALMRRQPDDARRAIRNSIAGKVRETCQHTNGYRVPIPATLITAKAV
ncbi:MAG: class I SAM-dependent methyltransferase [Saprospiraceae bacterium]|nr:class I SAM-dependent methyltransferase [Saprospiraceae bacterium]